MAQERGDYLFHIPATPLAVRRSDEVRLRTQSRLAVLKEEGNNMRRHPVLKATMVGVVVVLLAFGGTAAAADVIYGFNLVGPQTTASNSGASITMTGSGSFNTTAATVVAGGSFTERDAQGSVTTHGTWAATGFSSFASFGGPNSGHEGGTLLITVTLSPQGGTPQAGLPMNVTCEIFAPVFTFEGVTVGSFTTPVFGHTLFHVSN